MVLEWVSARIQGGIQADKYISFGIVDTDRKEIIAGVICHNYFERYRSIEYSIASSSPKWAQRHILRELFNYAFGYLKCGRITATCRISNQNAIKMNERLGFKREGVVRQGYGDEDMVIMGLIFNECKYR